MFNKSIVVNSINNKSIKPLTYKIMFFLLCEMDKNYMVKRYTQKEIGEFLDISHSNVNKAFRQLREIDILIRQSNDYYFNRDLFTK